MVWGLGSVVSNHQQRPHRHLGCGTNDFGLRALGLGVGGWGLGVGGWGLGQVLHQGNWTGIVAEFVIEDFAATGDVAKRSIRTILERISSMVGNFNKNFCSD